MTTSTPAPIEVHDIDLDEPPAEKVHELDTVSTAPPLVLVDFGASGDLAHRKLFPAIAALAEHNVLAPGFTVVGVARTAWSDEEFRKVALKAVDKPSPAWKEMVGRFRYISGEYGHPDTFDALKKILDEADATLGTAGNRIFYLATIPDLFGTVATALGKHGCATPNSGSFARLLVEKPFGRDLAGAVALNNTLHQSFAEDQIYRIDHYIGKETVQNLLALRFANAIFEPIW